MIIALISEAVEMASIARKKGLLALDGLEIKNEFLKRGIQQLVDGREPQFVQRSANRTRVSIRTY